MVGAASGDLRAVTYRERPELRGRVDSAEVWPEYNLHGDITNRFWSRLYDELADYQFALVDGDEVVGEGHTVPMAWDGSREGLPAGIDGALERAFGGEEPNTLCAMAIEVLPEHQSRRLSVPMLEQMKAIAAREGFETLLAPLRPSWKERYPLTPIERYASWRREDGLLFDPWMRVHERLGAEILKPEPQSLRISGTVPEWEDWTGMAFPDTATYVFPHGLAPLEVDRENDIGRYWEPNVWMLHRVT
jgi:hypothetical protein